MMSRTGHLILVGRRSCKRITRPVKGVIWTVPYVVAHCDAVISFCNTIVKQGRSTSVYTKDCEQVRSLVDAILE